MAERGWIYGDRSREKDDWGNLAPIPTIVCTISEGKMAVRWRSISSRDREENEESRSHLLKWIVSLAGYCG